LGDLQSLPQALLSNEGGTMKRRKVSLNKIVRDLDRRSATVQEAASDFERQAKCRHGHLHVSLAWANIDMTTLITQMTKPTAIHETPEATKAAEKAKKENGSDQKI